MAIQGESQLTCFPHPQNPLGCYFWEVFQKHSSSAETSWLCSPSPGASRHSFFCSVVLFLQNGFPTLNSLPWEKTLGDPFCKSTGSRSLHAFCSQQGCLQSATAELGTPYPQLHILSSNHALYSTVKTQGYISHFLFFGPSEASSLPLLFLTHYSS